ncbi:hypothetical protein Peur_032947 [Populus x canadensis]
MEKTQFLSVQTETYKLGFYWRAGKMEQSIAKGVVQTRVSPPPLRISNPARHFTYLSFDVEALPPRNKSRRPMITLLELHSIESWFQNYRQTIYSMQLALIKKSSCMIHEY